MACVSPLQISSTDNDGISPGGSQEGWGVADDGTGTTGFVSGNADYGKRNVTVSSFTATSDTATSVVDVGAASSEVSFQVTHDFKVSSDSDNLFVAEVTVKNTGSRVAEDLRYRRVVDWDAEPTAFDELVTIDGEKFPYLLFSSNEGFASPDPLSGDENYGASGFFTGHGPDDQGTLIDLTLGALDPGAQRTFKLYYGAAANESAALSAVQSVGAQVYSLAKPYTGANEEGSPNTFMMAFSVPQQPPSAKDDSATVDEDGEVTLNVLENDTDPEGDSLTVSDSTRASNGQVNCTEGGQCTYTPEANFNGEDTFTYTASDGNGGTDEGKVNVTVGAVNDTPEVRADSYTTDEDAPLTVDAPGVLVNDTDVDNDQLTAETLQQPQNGTLTLDSNGSFTYEPEADFNGEDSFTYEAADGQGGVNTATVTVTVDPVNDPPQANPDSATTEQGQSTTISVLDNDTDPENDQLTVTDSTQPSNGQVDCTQAGECTYTSENDFNGEDAFIYTVSDGNGGTNTATATIDVTDPIIPGPPPETTITSGSEGFTNSASASFSFSSNQDDATFECKLDNSNFEECSSPKEYTSLSDGPHSFEVKSIDSFGQSDLSPEKRTFTVDTTVPTTSVPTENFISSSQLGTSTIPVRLKWSGSDDRSGINRYELQHSFNGGSYSDVSLPSSASSTRTLNLSPGNHRFRVRAQDRAGNWSAWKTGASFALRAHQENNSNITYSGTWKRQAQSSAYGGYVKYSTASGSKARFRFTGRKVAFVTRKGPNRGRAQIYIDGTRVKTIDLYSSSTKVRQVVFTKSWGSSGTHTLEVRATGTKNSSSSGKRVDIDAFLRIN